MDGAAIVNVVVQMVEVAIAFLARGTYRFCVAGFLGVLLTIPNAAAQSAYPEKPIRLVVGFPAGSTVDSAARILSREMGEALGKPVVVEVVAGAAGNIAAERVAKSASDGYTLLFGGNQIVISPSLYKLPYEPFGDFIPISEVYVSTHLLVVHDSVPARSARELIAYAKAHPGELTFASGGSGSYPHIAGELLKTMAGIDFRHVPYKGVVAALPDLFAGRVAMTIGPTSQVISAVREGKLRALAVTSLERSAAFPELPTLNESGVPGYEATLWSGLLAPARTPTPIVSRLHDETVKVLARKEVRARFADLGMEVVGSSPQEFAAVIRSDLAKWSKVIREAGIKAD